MSMDNKKSAIHRMAAGIPQALIDMGIEATAGSLTAGNLKAGELSGDEIWIDKYGFIRVGGNPMKDKEQDSKEETHHV